MDVFEKARADCAAEIVAVKESVAALALAAAEKCEEPGIAVDRHGLLVAMDAMTNLVADLAEGLGEAGPDAARHCADALRERADRLAVEASMPVDESEVH